MKEQIVTANRISGGTREPSEGGGVMRAYWLIVVATVWSMATPANGQVQGRSGPMAPKNQSLFEALRQGNVAKVKAAIKNGEDVNSRDADGNTLLMQAAV